MRRETKLIHYGRPLSPGPANPPVVHASTIMHDTVASYKATKIRRETDDTVLSYGRRGTTTAHALAGAICDLEGGDACFLFPTGVAAVAGAISSYVGAGDHLLVVDTTFPATRTYCETVLRRNGVDVDYFPWDASDLSAWIRPNTKAVIVESPASQTFEVMDLPALCAWCRGKGVVVIADNTYGSGWLYRPLDLGCDVSIIAGTKYLCGHADVMVGAATVKGDAVNALRRTTHITGQTLAPDDAYACLRGMRTLAIRLERHEQNGIALARWFEKQKCVAKVLHPGMPDHPGSIVWSRDAKGCNGLFSVVFKEGFRVAPFLDGLKLFSIGSSWGGYESLALPTSPNDNRINVNSDYALPMVRFHAGLEHVEDLLEDLQAAL